MKDKLSAKLTGQKVHVLLLENIHPSAVHCMEEEGFHVEVCSHALKEEELREKITKVHVLGIRSKTKISGSLLSATQSLLAIGAFCIGTNQIDLEEASQLGVPVFNAPFSNTRSVAEMVMGEIIFLARRLFDRSCEVHAGKWRKIATGSYEVRGKTLGIIGYGHIGSQVGVLAEAFGLRTLFYDIQSKLTMGNTRALPSMDYLLSESDFVTLHVPETHMTKNLIGAEELKKMKPGSFLINASRGTVVDVDALASALKEGHLAGAAVDVFPDEPESNSNDFNSPLRGLSNVILTPHIAGSTVEAQAAIGKEVAVSLIKFIRSGATSLAVNFPKLELAQPPETHRIVNVHRNVPGVLRDINRIVSDRNANIHTQLLGTAPHIGYLIMDLDQDIAGDVFQGISTLETSIKTRIL